MSKDIVVITGSPRRHGNSAAMVDAFANEAEAAGHNITRFDAAFLKVAPCRACEACAKRGGECVLDDDFAAIAAAVHDADAVVFATPVYWYAMTAQLKAVIDRFFSFFEGKIDLSGKSCALISCAEEGEQTVFDGVRISIERSAALLGWTLVGEVLVPGVSEAGAIANTDGYQRAAELAHAL